MNDLAKAVDNFLYHGRYNKTDVAKQLSMTRQGLYSLLRKDSFSVDDANRILSVIGYQIEYSIKPL